MPNGATKLVGSTVVAAAMVEISNAFYPLRWGFFALAALMVVDFRLTRHYQQRRKKALPYRVALRKLVEKSIDFVCLIILIGAIAVVFDGYLDAQKVRWAGLAILYVIELATIARKYLRLYHPDISIDLLGMLSSKFPIFKYVKTRDRKTNETDHTDNGRGDTQAS